MLSYIGPATARKAGSVGLPLAGTQIEIVDLADPRKVLPRNERGEIRARGPQIMSGYRNRPDETAATLSDGWLYTGDIGELDDEGYLFIRDRKKDLVIVGGYNVYPREIDEVLYAHPDVAEAAAFGKPDGFYGEIIVATVVLKDGRGDDGRRADRALPRQSGAIQGAACDRRWRRRCRRRRQGRSTR